MNIKDTIGFKIHHILRLKRQLVDVEMRKLKFSRTEWQVLVWLRILASVSQKELLGYLDIDKAHLARTLEQLEKRQLIIRKSLPQDRRSLLVELSAQGASLISEIDKIMKKESNVMLKGINEKDKNSFYECLNKIEKNLLKTIMSEK